MKLWAGRFSKEADERVNDLIRRSGLIRACMRTISGGSMAHVMLGAQGIIPRRRRRDLRWS